ncbi:MAG: DUF1343 domain-containing protein [Opitutaceae bacterium]|nr:DUF1343 domain-containing protein [Opitutaceae bacterium]
MKMRPLAKGLDRRKEQRHVSRAMSGALGSTPLKHIFPLFVAVLGLLGCSATKAPTRPAPVAAAPIFTPPPGVLTPRAESGPRVMLGIDVLEANGFAAVKGKRIGLLTHPAGVNRLGVSTIEVLRHAREVKLVALYAAEHGIYGDAPAEKNIGHTTDRRTGLPVYSVYGATRKPTKAMLKGIDALVIDLQDIGTRSYTFVSAMKRAMEGCFEHGVEVIVLDRPNPLGGLKADGPLLDAPLAKNNYVGAFRVPYVHGLTMGELARMAKEAPSLDMPEAARIRGKLTVIPMRGWTRAMRWPETGLRWVPPSGAIQDFAAAQGYAMVGLGTYNHAPSKFDTLFRSGIGSAYIFRGLSHKTARLDVLEKELRTLRVPGIQYRRVSSLDKDGKPAVGIYVEIVDYDEWRPAELNFHLMKLACKLDPGNPFAPVRGRDFSGFLRHMGSAAFLNDLATKGARIDLDAWIRTWREQVRIYQEQSKRYWLYR